MATAASVPPQIEYYCPKVTPKVLLVKGPSGWVETFKRAQVDQELVTFMSPAPIDQVVGLFIKIRESADEPEPTTWQTVIGFIGRTMGCTPLAVPHTVGLAFWARVVLASQERAHN
jgi:hypothetical protein